MTSTHIPDTIAGLSVCPATWRHRHNPASFSVNRFLNPEFALGFLMATVLAVGVLLWQTAHSHTEIEKQECYEAAKKAGHKTEECKSLWEKTTSDPVALFTFVLSISTIALVGSTIALWVATKDSARIAQAAVAHTRNVERGYIVGGGPAKLKDSNGVRRPNLGGVSIGNYGKTPAILKSVDWGFADENAIPADAKISELFRSGFFAPGSYETLPRVDVIRAGVDPTSLYGVEFTLSDKAGKIFFGRFVYEILFDNVERYSTFKLKITNGDGGSIGLPGSYSDWT